MSNPPTSGAGSETRGVVTRLLGQASGGSKEAFDELLPLVYDELRGIASNRLRVERSGHTLNTTALVHEAYLNLVQQDRVEWRSRAHFFAVAARAMRRILINYAKMRNRDKRGGGAIHVPLEQVDEGAEALAFPDSAVSSELLALDQALERLNAFNPQGADVVLYRFFGGLTNNEIAEVMGVSEATVRRRWTMTKSWIRKELSEEGISESGILMTGASSG